jgi:hypothetical protein
LSPKACQELLKLGLHILVKMEEPSEAAKTLTEVETEELRLILSRVKAPAITAEKAL